MRERRVRPTFKDGVGGKGNRPLIRIFSSEDESSNAFASVSYRGTHYWIDDRDIPSKLGFSFLMFVFTLVETGERGAAPIVTVPTG